jgi:L-lactate dehydrogenase complex protein LldE
LQLGDPVEAAAEMSTDSPVVGLFVTCLVDLFRPSVGLAAVKLLEDAGCRVEVPAVQTCCGQPAYNSGDRADARAIAGQVIAAFEGYDFVVAPSGSCAGMIKHHYPALFDAEPALRARAEALAARTFELVSFLADVRGVARVGARFEGRVTYHDSCSGLRELGIKAQPRALLASVEGLALEEMADAEVCCGFGGTFCVKYPEISDQMVAEKTAAVEASGARTLLAGDLGCLLNMAGKLARQGSGVRVRHVAEVLAGAADGPAIGEAAADDGDAGDDGDDGAGGSGRSGRPGREPS